jgi:hypothetical protein
MKVRGLTVALVCGGLVLLAGVLVHERPAGAQGVPDVLRAQALELVDSRGVVRATIKTEPSGEVVLRLRDADGTIRVKLGASKNGSGLLLANESAEVGVQLLSTRNRTSVVLQRGERRRALTP